MAFGHRVRRDRPHCHPSSLYQFAICNLKFAILKLHGASPLRKRNWLAVTPLSTQPHFTTRSLGHSATQSLFLVDPVGFEPTTSDMPYRRSGQLSYGPVARLSSAVALAPRREKFTRGFGSLSIGEKPRFRGGNSPLHGVRSSRKTRSTSLSPLFLISICHLQFEICNFKFLVPSGRFELPISSSANSRFIH